jgi:SagB-type dehydrogenase family enzyme
MKRTAILFPVLLCLGLALAIGLGCSQGSQPSATGNLLALPAPATTGTVSVEAALAKRRSVRSFAEQDLTLKQIGQLAWAAQGITDQKSGHRTAPSAGATYPIEIYLAMKDGVFHYLPEGHKLEQRFSDDRRADLCDQASVRQAPLDVVITGVLERTRTRYGERAARYVPIEAGHVAQNIHLQAVALGLGSVSVGAFEDSVVAGTLNLPSAETPLYIIPVGHPSGS